MCYDDLDLQSLNWRDLLDLHGDEEVNTNIKEYEDQEGAGQDATFTLKPSVIKKIQDTAISKEQADIRVRQLQELIPLIKEANANGQLYSMSFMDELGVNEKSNILDKVTHGSAIFFNAAERFNRQATLIATYNLVRADMAKKAKEGKKGKERRQAARAERQKQRDEGRRGVQRTVKKVKETVEKVRDSRVGRAVEGAVNTAKAVKKGDVKGVVEGVKKTASAFSMVDPITGMPAQTQMSNMPPQPSNTMGNARPVFDARTQNIATGIYGGMQARQNAAGATPVYPGEMPVQSPFQNNHDNDIVTHKKLVGENTGKVQKDKKGNEFALVSETSKNFRKGDTIRPKNKMNFNKRILKDGFIMGGDYITRNNRIIN